MEVILRHAKDDLESLRTAQGMEDAGAQVFSVVWLNRPGTMMAFAVLARFQEPVTFESIDKAIDRRLFG